MTKDDIRNVLEKMGVKADAVADAVVARLEQKIENEKAMLDKETRRQVRKFWIVVSVATFALGVFVGQIF